MFASNTGNKSRLPLHAILTDLTTEDTVSNNGSSTVEAPFGAAAREATEAWGTRDVADNDATPWTSNVLTTPLRTPAPSVKRETPRPPPSRSPTEFVAHCTLNGPNGPVTTQALGVVQDGKIAVDVRRNTMMTLRQDDVHIRSSLLLSGAWYAFMKGLLIQTMGAEIEGQPQVEARKELGQRFVSIEIDGLKPKGAAATALEPPRAPKSVHQGWLMAMDAFTDLAQGKPGRMIKEKSLKFLMADGSTYMFQVAPWGGLPATGERAHHYYDATVKDEVKALKDLVHDGQVESSSVSVARLREVYSASALAEELFSHLWFDLMALLAKDVAPSVHYKYGMEVYKGRNWTFIGKTYLKGSVLRGTSSIKRVPYEGIFLDRFGNKHRATDKRDVGRHPELPLEAPLAVRTPVAIAVDRLHESHKPVNVRDRVRKLSCSFGAVEVAEEVFRANWFDGLEACLDALKPTDKTYKYGLTVTRQPYGTFVGQSYKKAITFLPPGAVGPIAARFQPETIDVPRGVGFFIMNDGAVRFTVDAEGGPTLGSRISKTVKENAKSLWGALKG